MLINDRRFYFLKQNQWIDENLINKKMKNTSHKKLQFKKIWCYILKFNSPDFANGDNNTAKQMKAEEML